MKTKVLKDIILNLIATLIPLLALQLIILPIIGQKVDANLNGLILTIISLMTLVPVTIGNVINNMRLLYDLEYKEKQLSGDFNILLILYSIINLIIMFFATWYYYGKFNLINIFFVLIISALSLLREYYIVAFWIELNYMKAVFNNILLVIGYFIGTILFYLTSYWQFIYLIGLIMSLIYILMNSDLHQEQYKRTILFQKTSNKTTVLLLSTFLGKIIQYIDKLLLFPILGGTMVSVYYVATLSGKLITMAISPVNGVMLGYFSKMKSFKKNVFILMLLLSTVVGALGYIICILISRPILSLIYPQFVNTAMKYIYITTFTTVIVTISSFISPVILKFCDTNWQFIINLISVITYFIFTLLLLKYFGLMGFCYGVLVANVIKLFIMIIIYLYSSNKHNMED